MLSIGIGIKNDTTKLSFANGRSYGINYNALYGTIRLFTLFEASGGWVFNGKESYEERIYEKLIGYSGLNVSTYNANKGNGFFIALSARMLF